MHTALARYYLGNIIKAAGLRLVLPNGKAIGHDDAKTLTLQFNRWRDLWRVMRSPSIGLGELYAEDRITIKGGDLYDLLSHLIDPEIARVAPGLMRGMRRIADMLQPLFEGRTLNLARENVRRHYDLGNDLYELFLDSDWQYSCAYFDMPDIGIDAAQKRKKEHIARKLQLGKDKSVLDIGCGWGGMALHLAPRAREVKGITLSTQQLERARERVRKSGRNNIALELQDYRKEDGLFDRIVSVGMLEHVGKNHYGTFFGSVARCLKPDGVALIHTIGRPGRPSGTDAFIRKYIFPGSYVPSLSQLSDAIERTDLAISDVEVLFLHYAETLRAWRMRFMANRKKVVAMRDEHFARIWEFYLASCEVAFRKGMLVVFQLQLLKPEAERPVTREYIYS